MDNLSYIEYAIDAFNSYKLDVIDRYKLAYIVLFFFSAFFGAIFLALYTVIKNAEGYSANGKLLGVVKSGSISDEEGNGRKFYRLVFEYVSNYGSLKKGVCSEFHDKYLKYKTSELVRLRVVPNEHYDDIYIDNEKGGLQLGVILLLVGLIGFTLLIGSIYALVAILIICLGVYGGVHLFLKNAKPAPRIRGSDYDIDSKSVTPIEKIT